MKYYQIRENEGDFKSIGVIQVSAENEYPLDKIQEAIESHLDEEITLLSVDLQERYGSLNIYFRKEDMTKEVFTAEETWLYF